MVHAYTEGRKEVRGGGGGGGGGGEGGGGGRGGEGEGEGEREREREEVASSGHKKDGYWEDTTIEWNIVQSAYFTKLIAFRQCQ